MNIDLFLITLFAAALLIICGTALRKAIPLLERLHLPASVIGGLLGLIIGPQLLGDLYLSHLGLAEQTEAIYKIGKELPAYLIIIVFAALMLGRDVPNPAKIWQDASPHLVVGYSIAWGQYVVGILLVLLILTPLLNANPLSSALIAIGFQGGYGTAAGLGDTYAELGFDEGYDLALGMATAGKVCAILVGLVLVNIAVKRDQLKSPEASKKEETKGDVPEAKAKKDYKQKRKEKFFSADTLVLHFALLCVAALIGYELRALFGAIESFFIAPENGVIQYIPLFPMALIGGLLLQLIISRTQFKKHLNADHLHSISHSFLDLLIVVAIATLSLKTVAANWHILTLLIVTGIGWNLVIFFFIAPRLYRNAAWARGVGDFAHSTGATTTGLLLMKVIDPSDRTGARSSFSLKQPFYEPIVGGGFITALALPLMHAIGLLATLGIFATLLTATLIFGFTKLTVKKRNPILS